MSRVLAVCTPDSDLSFGEHVRGVVAEDRFDLRSPEGVALIEALLRKSYPMATVLPKDIGAAGGWHATLVVEVDRDGLGDRGATDEEGTRGHLAWVESVHGQSGGQAFETAMGILHDSDAAAAIVEQAFDEVAGSSDSGTSVEAGGAAVEAATHRLAIDARAALGLVGDAAMSGLRPDQREALELAVFEDLEIDAIADRMQSSAAVIQELLRNALAAISSGAVPSAPAILGRWRGALHLWEALPEAHPDRIVHSLAVAHAWLEYQTATGAVASDEFVLITDSNRRFVAVTANAAPLLGRTSLVGKLVDDITAPAARPSLPDTWATFLADGAMVGDYACERPGLEPLMVTFRGYAGRPLPGLQVSYLRPLDAVTPVLGVA